MKKFEKIVAVEWHDAGSGSTCEDAANHYRVSVGYFVKRVTRGDDAGEYSAMENDGLSNIHFIPKGMVKKVTVVRKPK